MTDDPFRPRPTGDSPTEPYQPPFQTSEPAPAPSDPAPRGLDGPGDGASGARQTPATSGASPNPSAGPAAPDYLSQRYSPQPDSRPGWAAPSDPVAAARTTPESWFEPSDPTATTPVANRPARAASSLGAILAACLVSAVLASGGTYLALNASGALDRPVAAASTPPAGQQATTTTPVTIDESSAIVSVAAKVNPAVVRITSIENADQIDPFSQPTTGVGSGVIFDASGWILTNRHVVSGSSNITVELSDGRHFTGQTYGIDTLTDLAIVKVDATDLPTAPFGDSDELKIGQLVIAIGNPLGEFQNSVTSGIVSATGRSIQVEGGRLNNLIQTDAAINQGNSGGPLLDAAGNIIGINTAIASSANGIGFAIPSNIARPITIEALAGKQLARPYIGVSYLPIDVAVTEQYNLPVSSGAYIHADAQNGGSQSAVKAGSPADKAGLKDDDIIVSVNGVKLDASHQLDAVISQFSPGDSVTLEVLRAGKTVQLSVTLGTRPAGL